MKDLDIQDQWAAGVTARRMITIALSNKGGTLERTVQGSILVQTGGEN